MDARDDQRDVAGLCRPRAEVDAFGKERRETGGDRAQQIIAFRQSVEAVSAGRVAGGGAAGRAGRRETG